MVAIVGGNELGLGTVSGSVLGGQGRRGESAQGRGGEQVAVNAVTGNLILQRQDELLKGIGPDANVLRTYNSRGLASDANAGDDNGDNWRLGFSRRVYERTGTVNTAGSSVKRIDEDGAVVTYTYDTTWALYVATKGDGAYDTLSYNGSSNTWAWIDGSTQRVETYQVDGTRWRLWQVKDANGNTLTLSYNGSGLISQIADANGETVQISYDTASGKTANITEIRTLNASSSLLSRRVQYGYDSSNRLITVTVDLSPEDGSIADGKTYVTTYTYSGTSKRIASVQQSDGSRLEFTYTWNDGDYQIYSVSDVRGSDVRTTQFHYDTLNNQTLVTDPAGRVTVWKYDAQGQITAIQQLSANGASDLQRFTYDALGNVKTVTDARGNTAAYDYDKYGNRTRERDALGNTVVREYGGRNELLSETRYVVPNPDTANIRSAQTTYYIYDYPGLNLRYTISPEGRVTEYKYDSYGQQKAVITYLGDLSPLTGLSAPGIAVENGVSNLGATVDTVKVTSLASVLSVSALDTWVNGLPSPKQVQRTDTTYDFRGQIDKVTTYAKVDTSGNGIADGTQSTTQYIYDQAGNLLQTIDPRGVATTSVATDYLTTYTYDGLGRVKTATDARGQVTTYTYTDASRATAVALANGLITTTLYDQGGLATSVVQSTTSQSNLGTTTYTYDKLGNLVKEVDPTGAATYHVYDAAGRKVADIDPTGAVVEYVYDDGVFTSSAMVSRETFTYSSDDVVTLNLALTLPAILDSTGALTAVATVYDQLGRAIASTQGEFAATPTGSNQTLSLTLSVGGYTPERVVVQLYQGGVLKAQVIHTDSMTLASDAANGGVGVPRQGVAVSTASQQFQQGEHIVKTIRYVNTVSVPAVAADQLTLGGANNVRPSVSAASDRTSYTFYDKAGRKVGDLDATGALVEYLYDATPVTTSATVAQETLTYSSTGQISIAVQMPTSLGSGSYEAVATGYFYGGEVLAKVSQTFSGGTANLTLTGNMDTVTVAVYKVLGQGEKILVSTTTQKLPPRPSSGAVTLAAQPMSMVFPSGSRFVETVRYAELVSTAAMNALKPGDLTKGMAPALRPATPADGTPNRYSGEVIGADGLLLAEVDGDGYWTAYKYNAAGQLIENIRYAYTDRSQPAASDPAQVNQHTYYLYNARGQLTGVVDAEKYLTEYQYDLAGNKNAQIRYATALSNYSYSAVSAENIRPAANALDRKVAYVYDALNRLTSQTDWYTGSSEFLVYTLNQDVLSGPSRIIKNFWAPEEQSLVRQYDVQGRLAQELSPEGALALNMLSNPTAAQIAAVWAQYGISYTYDAAGRVTSKTEATDAQGRRATTWYYYDAAGRLTETVNALGEVVVSAYNAFGDVNSTTRYGKRMSTTGLVGGQRTAIASALAALSDTSAQQDFYGYTKRGELVNKVIGYDGGLGFGNEIYTYNAFGELTRRSVMTSAIPESYVLDRYTYNNRGLRTSVVQDTMGMLNLTTATVYDGFGRATQVTDARGVAWYTNYDGLGRVIWAQTPSAPSTSFTYDAFGQVLTQTNALNQTTTYTYALTSDQTGQAVTKVTMTTPEGIVTSTEKNLLGLTVRIKDGKGATTTYGYDVNGRLTTITPPAGTADSPMDKTTNTYDKAGHVISTTDANGTVTTYTYDIVGRVIARAVDPTGLNLTTRTLYDAKGEAIWSQDANGVWIKTEYDAKGQVSAVIVDPLQIPQNNNADTLTTNPGRNGAPALNIKTAYSYDNRGLVLTVTNGADTAQAQTVRTVYDNLGRARFTLDALNYLTQHEYDSNGNDIRSTRYNTALSGLTDFSEADVKSRITALNLAGDPKNQIEVKVYDQNNRITHCIDAGNYVTQFTYDGAGRLIKEYRYANPLSAAVTPSVTYSASLLPAPTVSGLDRTIRHIYDRDGRERYTVDGEGYVTQHDYDPVGHETQRIRYGRTAAAMGIAVSDITAVANLQILTYTAAYDVKETSEYDAAGRLTKTVDGEGVVTLHKYDKAGNETDVIVAYGTADQAVTRKQYDAAGRLKEETLGYNKPEAATTRYTLDKMGQRIEIIDPRGVELIETDSDWAKAKRTEILGYEGTAATLTDNVKNVLRSYYTTYQQFDARGLVTKITNPLGGITLTEYDAFGNAVKITDPNGNAGYFYFDANNRNVAQLDPEGYVTKMQYNAFGTVDSTTRHYTKYTGTVTTASIPSVATHSLDQTTTIEHDKRNLQTKIIDAENNYEETTYDAFGNKKTYRNKLGGQYTYEYDRKGNVVIETAPTTYTATGQANPAIVKKFEYDARGNLTKLIEAYQRTEQRITQFQYDRLNRQIAIINDAFTAFDASSNADVGVTPTTTKKYDVLGNLIEEKDPKGNRTLYYYDALNRKVAQISPLGQLTVWKYNDGSKPIAELAYSVEVALPATAGGTPPNPIISGAYPVREKRFKYDANNRLISSTIPNAQLGQMVPNATNFSLYNQDVVVQHFYDATGNEILTIDASGGTVFSYYDKLGRKTLQVDAESYITAWQYDAGGNVVQQRQYANKLSVVPTTSTAASTLIANAGNSADDRVTQFDYDRLARITQKRVLSVAHATVNSGNGALATGTATSTVTFTYNALGNITSTVDATGTTNITYDVLGRKITEKGAAFTDFNGVPAVRPQTDYDYNALGLVRREIDRGLDNAVETDDRITVTAYTTGGLIASETDATGAVIQYRYDANGNITKKTLVGRKNADGVFVLVDDVTTYQYNAANKETWHKDNTTGEIREARYNTYGEITGKRLNGGGSGAQWQETVTYDGLGRVLRSNAGDGVFKFYFYDANGNATLQIQSAGADLSTLTAEQVLQLPANQTFITLSQYDKRNQLVSTYQPKMSTSHDQVAVEQFITQQVGASFSAGNISVTTATQATRPVVMSGTAGSSVVSGNVTVSGGGFWWFYPSDPIVGFDLSFPDLSALGNGNIHVVYTPYSGAVAGEAFTQTCPGNATSAGISGFELYLRNSDRVVISLYKETSAGNILISQMDYALSFDLNAFEFVFPPISQPIKRTVFNGLPPNANRVMLFARPQGSGGAWTLHQVPQTLTGTFSLDWTAWARGNYEYRLFALDASANVVSAQTGVMALLDAGASINQSPMRVSGGTGVALMDNAGVIHFMEQGTNATSLTIRYRAGNGAWTTQTLSAATIGGAWTPGWFTFNPAAYGLSGTYEYVIEARGASGVVNTASSTFTTGVAASVLEDIAGIVSFTPPVGTGTTVVGVGDTVCTLSYSNYVPVLAYIFEDRADVHATIQISPSTYPTRVAVTFPPDITYGQTTPITLEQIFAPNQVTGVFTVPNSLMHLYEIPSWARGTEIESWWEGETNVRVRLFRQTPGGEIPVADQPLFFVGRTLFTTHVIPGQDFIDFKDQPAGTNRLWLMARRSNTNDAWGFYNLPWNGSAFPLYWSDWARGNYEFQYVALDAGGQILNRQGGTLVLSDSAPSVTQNSIANSGGMMFMDGAGGLQVMGQSTATSLVVRYRARGNPGAWSTATLGASAPGGVSTPGWFYFSPAAYGLNGNYDVMFEAKDAGGGVVNRVQGSFSTGNPNSVSALTGYQDLPETVHVTGQPSNANSVRMYYRVNGSTGAYESVWLSKVNNGAFDWDASAIAPDRFANYQYEYKYETYDNGGILINRATGVLQLGATPAMLSHTNIPADTKIQINPPQANATKLAMYYRTNGSTGAYTRVDLTRANSSTAFAWDMNALIPAGRTLSLDYYYELYNSANAQIYSADGNAVHVDGVINIGATISSGELKVVVLGTANVEAVIHRVQTHNAFGEVSKEIDGRGNVTDFKYNALGLMVEKLDPQTDITLSNGFIKRDRPTTRYYYDLAGRLVGVDDPNGARNTLLLRAGTADDGSASVLTEFHADGGKKSTAYDVFGDARKITDEVNRVTLQDFDKAGRLVQLTRPQRVSGTASYLTGPLIETYEYDQLGNRIAHTNTNNLREKTDYDSLGRITKATSFGGLSTTYTYTWSNVILGVGGVAVGGYQKATALADGHVTQDNVEYFGRTTWHRDFGNHEFTYGYNTAGWLMQQTSATTGQNISYSYYANSYLKSIQDNITGALTSYEYDVDGNRILEAYTRTVAGVKEYYQASDIYYDELNRVVKILDPKAEIRYEYDANGNRRHMWSYYHDGVDGTPRTQDYWYDYDAMNRFTITMGQLSTGARGVSAADTSVSIVTGSGATSNGVQIGYNAASERVFAFYAATGIREDYSYTSDGYLEDMKIGNVVRTRRVNDALGRVTAYTEFDTAGGITYNRSTGYGNDNQLTSQYEVNRGTSTSTTFVYQPNSTVLASTAATTSGTTINTYYTYDWWDEAKQLAITATPYNPSSPNWKSGYSKFSYDVNGHLLQVDDQVGNRTLKYSTDAQGLILTRKETASNVNIQHSYYYVDGKRVGDVGNDGVEKVSYAEELAARGNTESRKDKYKNFKPVSSADFDQNYEPIDMNYPGAVATSFTVRLGDTLQSIAAAVWGDRAMWYLIADANGLNGSETLKAGQVLTIPNKVTNIHNNSTTYHVYNAGETLGDTSPTIPDAPPPPKPKKKGGCGGVGMILIAVVAVVVTVITAGAALAAIAGSTATFASVGFGYAFAAGAIGAAAGSIVSQGLSMATGMQDSFSWKQVGMSALGGGLTAGLGSTTFASSFNSNATIGAIQRAAVSSTATQGLAVATGMQEKFSWTQVAASAMGAYAGETVGKALSGWTSNAFGSLARNTVSSMANGGMQSFVSGQRPNWAQIAAESFGQTLGNANQIIEADRRAIEQQQKSKVSENLLASRGSLRADYEQHYGLDTGQVIDSYTPDMFRASQYASSEEIAALYPNSYAGTRDPAIIAGIEDPNDVIASESWGQQNQFPVSSEEIVVTATRLPDSVDDGLQLPSVNLQFAPAIRRAAERANIRPAAMAMFVHIEAAKEKNGAWKPDSYNSKSKARGLTQMTEPTWMSLSKMKGAAPYEAVQSLKRSLGRMPTNAEILNLRNDPTLSIEAAGDLIADNLKVMKNYGYDAGKLDVADREKFAYALHHEGAGAVERMISGSFTDAMGEKHFMSNVPNANSRAPYLAASGNSYGKAYQKWFNEMIDNRFHPQPFSTERLNAPDRSHEIFGELRRQQK